MVGNLMYLTTTRPDIMHVVNLVSRFMETLKETHSKTSKRILRYVNVAKEYGILYTATSDFRFVDYTDSDSVGNVNDKKSTSGYVFHMGLGAISRASKK